MLANLLLKYILVLVLVQLLKMLANMLLKYILVLVLVYSLGLR